MVLKALDLVEKDKPKSVEKSKGTRYAGKKVDPQPQIKGNPTKKSTSGKNYQERVGNQGPARGTEGTNFRGSRKPKVIRSNGGANYKGEKVSQEQGIKGNPNQRGRWQKVPTKNWQPRTSQRY